MIDCSPGTAGPNETTRSTADPRGADEPQAGVCLITCPAGTVPLFSDVIAPTTRLAATMAASAAA